MAYPSLRRVRGLVTRDHEGVEVGNQFVPPFDGVSNKGRDFGVHPWLDHTAYRVVVLVCLETIYCESGGMDSKLDPAEEKFGCGLRSFEAADVVAVGLMQFRACEVLVKRKLTWRRLTPALSESELDPFMLSQYVMLSPPHELAAYLIVPAVAERVSTKGRSSGSRSTSAS